MRPTGSASSAGSRLQTRSCKRQQAIAARLASLPPSAVQATKRALNRHLAIAEAPVFELALAAESSSFDSVEHREAIERLATRSRETGQEHRSPRAEDHQGEGPAVKGRFALTEDQPQFRQTLRRFAEEQIGPHAAEADRTASFPWESFEACRKMDLMGLGLPQADGGSGADTVTQAIAIEELARVCTTTSGTVAISKLAMMPLVHFGSEHLRRRYIPRVTSGGSQGSYCLSEADAGSDVAAIRCRAVRDGNTYVLTRVQVLDHCAGISDTYTVFETDTRTLGTEASPAFWSRRSGGRTVAKHEDKMGLVG